MASLNGGDECDNTIKVGRGFVNAFQNLRWLCDFYNEIMGI